MSNINIFNSYNFDIVAGVVCEWAGILRSELDYDLVAMVCRNGDLEIYDEIGMNNHILEVALDIIDDIIDGMKSIQLGENRDLIPDRDFIQYLDILELRTAIVNKFKDNVLPNDFERIVYNGKVYYLNKKNLSDDYFASDFKKVEI